MENIATIIADLWGNGYIRFIVIVGALAFAPFYLLSMAVATLGGN